MIIEHSLKNAIEAVGLSASDMRYGAALLAIFLLERIWSAESNDPHSLSVYYSRYELEFDPYCGIHDDLRAIGDAKSMLYYAYGLERFRRLGAGNYLHEVEANPNFSPL